MKAILLATAMAFAAVAGARGEDIQITASASPNVIYEAYRLFPNDIAARERYIGEHFEKALATKANNAELRARIARAEILRRQENCISC
jgi:hypothetical protein